jgi:hypothetical protein
LSYKTKIDVVQNDFGYNLDMKLQDVDGNPVDLTGAGTVTLFCALPNASTSKVIGTCNVTSTSGGSVRYIVGSADFTDAEQIYSCEVETNWGTKVTTARGLTIHVRGELPEGTY